MAIVALGLGGSAVADEAAGEPTGDPAGDPKTARSFLAGPSLYETGRVGAMTVSDPGSKIEQTPDHGVGPKEMVVQPAAVEVETSAAGASNGFINASVLAREIGERLATLNACRIAEARRQQLAWNEVPAGQLTLQWTILPTGAVAEAEVTAIDPIDLHVLDCVKRQMNQWTFARPRGGAVRLSRPFAFR